MAKNKPMTDTSNEIEKMRKQEKSTVSVNSTKEPKKAKKSSAKKNSDKPNIFKRMLKGIKGVFSELKKVTWPKGKEVGSSTAVVLVVVVLFFVVLFIIDYVLGGIMGLITTGEWTRVFT